MAWVEPAAGLVHTRASPEVVVAASSAPDGCPLACAAPGSQGAAAGEAVPVPVLVPVLVAGCQAPPLPTGPLTRVPSGVSR